MTHEVLTYQLEIQSKEKFKPKEGFENQIEIKRIKTGKYINYTLFLGVGLPHLWYERLLWKEKEWNAYLSHAGVKYYLGFVKNQIIGFFEFNEHPDKTEIKYFGLLPEFIGKGLGGYFLSNAVAEAFKIRSKKVWLHTCVYDHKNALKNYLDRGFEIIGKEYVTEEVFNKDDFVKIISEFYGDYFTTNRQ